MAFPSNPTTGDIYQGWEFDGVGWVRRGGGGGGSPDAVLYIEQTLDAAQKAQAQTNIGVTGFKFTNNDVAPVDPRIGDRWYNPTADTEYTWLDDTSGWVELAPLPEDDHADSRDNPHEVTKAQVGLGNVDNTSDADKPISTATQTALDGKQADLGFTPENAANKGANNGYAPLNAEGKIPESFIPAVAISDVFLVASETAMLSLTAQRGDVAIRSDTSTTLILQTEPASNLANWAELRTPADLGGVLSVAGKTGVVELEVADITGLQAALASGDHTHTASQITNFNEAVDDRVAALIQPGTNIDVVYDDNAGTFTISATGELGATTAAADVTFSPVGNVAATTVQAAIAELDTEKFPKTGGDVTGPINIYNDAGWPSLRLEALLNRGALINFKKDSKAKWAFEMESAATSNLRLVRYDDAEVSTSAMIINRSDGSIVIGGQLSLSPASGNTQLKFDKIEGSAAQIVAQRNSLNRWILQLATGTAEGGANAGSNFSLLRYSDAGALLGAALSINRDTSRATFEGDLRVNGSRPVLRADGDIMTGALTIEMGFPSIVLNRPDTTTAAQIVSRVNGSNRFVVNMGVAGAEGTGNTGGDFSIVRYSNTGGSAITALSIGRDNGMITIGGNLLIAAGQPTLRMNKASATAGANIIVGEVGGVVRWHIMPGDQAEETGSNAGSNFRISRYSDAGSFMATALEITRSSGAIQAFGDIVVAKTNPFLYLNKGTGNESARLIGRRDNVDRWHILLAGNSTESGGNTGSDFGINAYDDAGAYLGGYMSIRRTDGAVTFSGSSLVVGGAQLHPYLTTNIEIGRNLSGDRNSYIDLHSHGDPGANDYSGRIIRYTGINGNFEFFNVGTGMYRFRGSSNPMMVQGESQTESAFVVIRNTDGWLLRGQRSDGSQVSGIQYNGHNAATRLDFVDDNSTFMSVGTNVGVTINQTLTINAGTLMTGGNLTLQKVNPAIYMDGDGDSSNAILWARNGGTARWAWVFRSGIETGSNDDGSNFDLNRYNNAGVNQGSVLSINRATGETTLRGAVNFNGSAFYVTPNTAVDFDNGEIDIRGETGASKALWFRDRVANAARGLLYYDPAANGMRLRAYNGSSSVSEILLHGSEAKVSIGVPLSLTAEGSFSAGFTQNSIRNVSVDLDVLREGGTYTGAGYTNGPYSLLSNEWSYVEVIRFSDNNTYALQRFSRMNPIAVIDNTTTWERRRYGTAWGAWAPMTGYVTPEHYGAIGNGSTDDTAAVQLALRSGFDVQLRGKYRITSQISFGNGLNPTPFVKITGMGRCHFRLDGANAGLRWVGPTPNSYNNGSIVAHDFDFEVPRSDHAVYCLRLESTGGSGATSKTFDIRNIGSFGTSGSTGPRGGIHLINQRNGIVEGCVHQGNRSLARGSRVGAGVLCEGTGDPVDFLIHNNHAYFCAAGVQIMDTHEGIMVDKPCFVMVDKGVSVQSDENPISGDNSGKQLFTVTGGHINSWLYGVEMLRPWGWKVTGIDMLVEATGSNWQGVYGKVSSAQSQKGWVDGCAFRDLTSGGVSAGVTIGVNIEGHSTGNCNTRIGVCDFTLLRHGILLQPSARQVRWSGGSVWEGCISTVSNNGTNNSAY